MFYQLDLKLRQFVLGATDLKIDFQKLVYNNDDCSFELAYANEVTVDGKRSPQGKGFVYELKQNGLGLTSRSWAGSGWLVLGLSRPGVPRRPGMLRPGFVGLGSLVIRVVGSVAS